MSAADLLSCIFLPVYQFTQKSHSGENVQKTSRIAHVERITFCYIERFHMSAPMLKNQLQQLA